MWDTSLFESVNTSLPAKGFVFVDSDIIMIRNCDELVDAIVQNEEAGPVFKLLTSSLKPIVLEEGLHAVANFRMKKKEFPMKNPLTSTVE